jgi:hypothetical protein
VLVMGPWIHGGWSRAGGGRIGNIGFGSNTSDHFQKDIELPFFNHFLKGEGNQKLPEAYMFETGANKWRTFDTWPPKDVETKKLYFHKGGKLSFQSPVGDDEAHDEYVSDPAKPVPYTETVTPRMTIEYMEEDQRFAGRFKQLRSPLDRLLGSRPVFDGYR